MLGGHVHPAARVHAQILGLDKVLVGLMGSKRVLAVVGAHLGRVVALSRTARVLLLLAHSVKALGLLVSRLSAAVNLVPLR